MQEQEYIDMVTQANFKRVMSFGGMRGGRSSILKKQQEAELRKLLDRCLTPTKQRLTEMFLLGGHVEEFMYAGTLLKVMNFEGHIYLIK